MLDTIDEIVELLETAYAERNWQLVISAIERLNEIPDGGLPSEYDDFGGEG